MALRDSLETGQAKVDLVPGSPKEYQVKISNGSAVRHAHIVASSAASAYLWASKWAGAVTDGGSVVWQASPEVFRVTRDGEHYSISEEETGA